MVAFFASLVCSHVLTRKSRFGAVHVMQRKFGNSYSTYLSTFLTRGHSFKIFWYWALSSACTSTAVRASSIRTSARSEHTSQTIWNVQGTSLNQVAGVFHPYGFSSHSFQRNSNLFAEILLSTNGTKGRVLLALSCRPDVKGRCFHTNEPKTPAVELVCKHCLKIRKFKKYQRNNEISKCQKFNDTSKSRKCLMSSMCFQTFDFFVWTFDFLILNCWVFECSMLLLNLVYIFCLILSNVSISDLFIVYWIFTLRGCRAFWLLSIHENGRYKCFGAFTCLCRIPTGCIAVFSHLPGSHEVPTPACRFGIRKSASTPSIKLSSCWRTCSLPRDLQDIPGKILFQLLDEVWCPDVK